MKILIGFFLCFGAGSAFAQDYVVFHSPTGNIQCALYGGDYAGVRCDMAQLTPTYTTMPEGCEFDWGSSFGLDPNSRKGYLACVSDVVADTTGLELGYGEEVTLAGITCQSEKTGLTCINPAGHGFTLSKAKQKLF